MRSYPISCDWCEELIDRADVYVLKIEHQAAFGTWEGARYSWDFCSPQCMTAWQDWQAMDRIGCHWSWRDAERPKDHLCVCKDTRNCKSNHGRRTQGKWARDCWCKCGSHSPRPENWPEKRFDDYLAEESGRRADVIRARLKKDWAPL